MASYVDNYGSYQKPFYNKNTALLAEVSKRFDKVWGLEFSLAIAGDIGNQYGNSFGAYLRIAKSGIISTF
jgi:hypothetical protein